MISLSKKNTSNLCVHQCNGNNYIYKGLFGSFYKYVHSKTSTLRGVAPLKGEFENIVITDSSKAEVLNTYFSSIFDKAMV